MAFKNKGATILNKALGFARGYAQASIERSIQIDGVVSVLDSTDYPLIVGGDFNESPFSNSYRKIDQVLDNAHQSAGSGFGTTFPLKKLPIGVRIDHLFSSESFEVSDFEVYDDVTFSEHYPIMATYRFHSQ